MEKQVLTKILRSKQVEDITGYSRVTLWRMIKNGEFPSPRKTGKGNRIGWLENEIAEWQHSLPRASYPV